MFIRIRLGGGKNPIFQKGNNIIRYSLVSHKNLLILTMQTYRQKQRPGISNTRPERKKETKRKDTEGNKLTRGLRAAEFISQGHCGQLAMQTICYCGQGAKTPLPPLFHDCESLK